MEGTQLSVKQRNQLNKLEALQQLNKLFNEQTFNRANPKELQDLFRVAEMDDNYKLYHEEINEATQNAETKLRESINIELTYELHT